MPRLLANVYIDGFNLCYRCLKGTPYRWLDLRKLCRFLLPEFEIGRIRYFTAVVESREDDPRQQQRQQAYLRALRTVGTITIHLGTFQTSIVRLPLAHPRPGRPRTVSVLRTEEKGSDVNLATHLLMDGFRGDYQVGVLVSNDSDLIEPIKVVREELSLPIGVVVTDPTTVRSKLPADFTRRIRGRQLADCQFPRALSDVHGTIHRA